MKHSDKIQIVGGVEIAEDVKRRIMTTGVRGLDFKKAEELGVFKRIANLLCVVHSSIMAAYFVYGEVEYLMDELKARRNEIAREMTNFEKAFDRFVHFWTNYYSMGSKEISVENERLYHKIMEWLQMPENWQLGDAQQTDAPKDACIHVELPDNRVFNFYKTNIDQEYVKKPEETWGVIRYDLESGENMSVNTDMDKASALMVAKRLSAQDPDNLYSAAIIRDVVEKRTEVTPFKIFKANETIGKLQQ